MDSDWLTTRVIATNILDRVLVYKQFLDEALEKGRENDEEAMDAGDHG